MEKEVIIRYRDKNVKTVPVGPSLLGYIYSSIEESRFYRLLQREDIPKFSMCKEIEECIGKPHRQGIAPIVDEGDAFIDNNSFYCVIYELGGVSLTKIASGSDHALLLACLAKVYTAMNTLWSDESQLGGYLMPADIVINLNHPWLLGLPVNIAWPRFEALLEQPERILYMPPEIIRGNRYLVRDRNRALYACGVLLAKSLFDFKVPPSPVELFRLASSGSLFDRSRHTFKLPYWIEKAEILTSILAVLNTAVSPDPRKRAELNLIKSAADIEELAKSLDPLYLAEDIRAKKKFKEALDFISDVSLGEENFELLLLAAEIAYKDLKRPVEAIELYERAITIAPSGDWTAHFAQLEILLKIAVMLETDELLANFTHKLDAMLWRDYKKLPLKEQETYALVCAGYFTSKGKYAYAQNALHQHMYDGKTFLWWKFQYTITYAEALLGEVSVNAQRIEIANQFLDSVKIALSRIMNLSTDDPNKRDFSDDELDSYATRITKMNSQMLDLLRNQKMHERKKTTDEK